MWNALVLVFLEEDGIRKIDFVDFVDFDFDLEEVGTALPSLDG